MAAKTDTEENDHIRAAFRSHGILPYPGVSAAVAAGARYYATNVYGPYILEAENSGTTNASAEPAWSVGLGDITPDNDVNFKCYHTGTLKRPIYIALFTGAPGEAGGGVEVAGGSYARAQLDPDDANWAAPVAGNATTSNLAPVTFPDPSADWGSVTHWAVMDAATGGTMRKYAALIVPAAIAPPSTNITFAAGALTYQEDN